VWLALERLLRDESIEQNVEYWRDRGTYYVRVPWQLYLLALAARLRYYRSFATYAGQTRLRSILTQVIQGGFRYPHSGEMISSRTNAILYDVLGRIQSETRRYQLVSPVYWIDRLRTSTLFRRVLGAAALLLIVYSVWQWIDRGADLGALAGDFLGPALIALVALWTKKR